MEPTKPTNVKIVEDENLEEKEKIDLNLKKKRKSISFKLDLKEESADNSSNSSSSKPQSIERSKTRKSTADKETRFRINRKRFDSIEVNVYKKFWKDHEEEFKEFEHTPDVIRNTKRNSVIGYSNINLKNLTDLSEDSS